MRAVILSAGMGTRLRPLTDHLPKPACPVLDRPLFWYGLALLARSGIREVAFNSHHLAEKLAEVAREGARRLGVAVTASHEPEILGTGGALRRLSGWLGSEPFVVLNGDILFDVDLPAAIEAHRREGAVATMVMRPMPPGAPWRPVHVDGRGQVVRIAGDGPPPRGTTPWLFTGVHVLTPEILGPLPPGASGLHEAGYGPLLAAGAKVCAHRDDGYWNDRGTPARYREGNLALLRNALPRGRFALLDLPPVGESYLGPGARVEGEVRGSVIGAEALVPAGAVVIRSVLWPGTVLRPGERLVDGVAAGELRVPAAS